MLRKPLSVFAGEFLNKLLEGCQFSLVDELELLDEENEMLERGVEVGLLLQLDHLVKVLVVDVCIHAE